MESLWVGIDPHRRAAALRLDLWGVRVLLPLQLLLDHLAAYIATGISF
jgi:hypothetical protein